MGKLSGKTAVITGGAGGIGLATARLFLAEDANVLLVDLRPNELSAAMENLNSERARGVAADVTQPDQTAAYIQAAVTAFGGVDILVCNAGIEGVISPIHNYPLEMFDRVMAVNVRGAWLALQGALPHLARRGGSVIFTSSTAGVKGGANMAPYVASKHAIMGLMRSAALEYAPYRIRVNAVNPGPIHTRMIESIEQQAGGNLRQASIASIPLQRYGTADEVAKMMLFLASDDSAYCTGGAYLVDGGQTTV